MNKKEAIVLDNSSNNIPLFSDAIRAGDFLYSSGQGPIDPETGKTVDGGILAQTRQTLENCKLILKRAGSEMKKVIKVSIFLKDTSDFPKMNNVYHEYFPKDIPARSCIVVKDLARKDWKIEIEFISLT